MRIGRNTSREKGVQKQKKYDLYYTENVGRSAHLISWYVFSRHDVSPCCSVIQRRLEDDLSRRQDLTFVVRTQHTTQNTAHYQSLGHHYTPNDASEPQKHKPTHRLESLLARFPIEIHQHK